jgi:hypothetical protein
MSGTTPCTLPHKTLPLCLNAYIPPTLCLYLARGSEWLNFESRPWQTSVWYNHMFCIVGGQLPGERIALLLLLRLRIPASERSKVIWRYKINIYSMSEDLL